MDDHVLAELHVGRDHGLSINPMLLSGPNAANGHIGNAGPGCAYARALVSQVSWSSSRVARGRRLSLVPQQAAERFRKHLARGARLDQEAEDAQLWRPLKTVRRARVRPHTHRHAAGSRLRAAAL